MTQRRLFATERPSFPAKPARKRNRYGDKLLVWTRSDRAVKVVLSRSICGVALPERFKVIRILNEGESLVSRHRRRNAALRVAERIR